MLYSLGRVLQIVGMIILPVAMAGNAMEKLDLKEMLTMATIGGFVFFAGWFLQQMSKK